MSEISESYVYSIVSKVASKIGLTEWRHSQIKFETIAQNYFGVLIPIILVGKKTGVEVNIDVVLKVAPTDERYRVSGALTLFFLREIYVYSTILEKYRDLQRSFSPVSQYVMPTCYYVCNEYCNEVIVMQNMCGDGYKPYTGSMFLDVEHMKLSLRSLAKFHALSFVMRETNGKLYEEAEKICLPLTEASNKRFIEILLDRLQKVLQAFEYTKYVPLLLKLRQNCVTLVDSAYKSVQKTCISHGDIWKENILFKYKDKTPISACIIDYQTARTSSPAFDTLYLITSSTSSELRHKHYEELLAVYYQMFEQVLKEAGLDPSVIYSSQMFENDLKVVSPACFIIANTALWLSNGLQQEGHIKSKHIYTTDEEKAQAMNNYKGVIKNIIDDYVRYGYFSLCEM